MSDALQGSETNSMDDGPADLDTMVSKLFDGDAAVQLSVLPDARSMRTALIPRLMDGIRERFAAARLALDSRALDSTDCPTEASADANTEAEEGSESDDHEEPHNGNGAFVVLCLLAEFRAREAWPLIDEIYSEPNEIAYDVFGNYASRFLPRVVMTLADDPQAVFDRWIRDGQLSGGQRWGAAEGYVYLFKDGQLSRDAALEAICDHLREGIEKRDGDIVAPLIDVIDTLDLKQAAPLVEQALDSELVDESIVDRDYLEERLKEVDEDGCDYSEIYAEPRIDDAFLELQTLVAEEQEILVEQAEYEDPDHEMYDEDFFDSLDDDDDEDFEDEDDFEDDYEDDDDYEGEFGDDREDDDVIGEFPREEPAVNDVTFRSSTPHVGRNEPCPCGSGKKFKKCCINKMDR